MRRRPSCTPSPIAYHESGHAIVALKLGAPITFATIVPDKGQGYAGAVYRPSAPAMGDAFAWHRRNVIISFAGPAAQRRSHPRSNVWHSAKFDRESWEVVADCLFNEAGRRKGFLQDAAALARQLVADHWLAVDRVARELEAHQSLSGHAIERIIAEAEAEWLQIKGYRGGLTPFAYAREQALDAQGLPPLRRSHIAAAALRATLAGAADVEAAVFKDLIVDRGHPAAEVIREWTRAKGALAA